MPESTRVPAAGQLRASDADRDQAIELLGSAVADGRLTLEEYSERSAAALTARTRGELEPLTADVPASVGAVTPVSDGAPEVIAAILGNESRKGAWVVPAHIVARSVLGDCHLELQHAVIRQPVTTIEATVRFGAMTIFVPDGIDVRLSGRAILGEKSSQLRSEPPPGAPVLVVRADVICGQVTVRRPSRFMR